MHSLSLSSRTWQHSFLDHWLSKYSSLLVELECIFPILPHQLAISELPADQP